MKVFVTGGCGQVGSHVVEMALERGDDVVAIDDLSTGRRVHLPQDHDRLTFVEGSIANQELVNQLLGDFKPDTLVHTAASYKDPDDWYNDTLTNCVGGTNLIRASLDNKVGRFVYFQTALCYGVKPSENPITRHAEFHARHKTGLKPYPMHAGCLAQPIPGRRPRGL